MVSVCISNYYEGELMVEDGIPRTTKENKNYHGYGIRSIKRIIEKYSGSMTIDIENHIFRLSLLFPSLDVPSTQ
jgi:sensor histidine kinase regulating citrate/malate metabolism